MKFSYDGTHENHTPLELLEHAVLAERSGFDTMWNSDHFHPWGHTGGSGGFSWVWMGSAAERTSRIPLGTAVTAPGYRYPPGIVAQAFATLAYMYEGRIFLGLGVGESLNETPLGFHWPKVPERIRRFEECVQVVKLLWDKSFVDYHGNYYRLKQANLYTKPAKPIPLYIASQGPKVSTIAGKYADGYLHWVNLQDPESIRNFTEVCWPAVRKGAESMDRDPDTIERAATMFVSYDEDYEKAVEGCLFWKGSQAAGGATTPIHDPREIDALGEKVSWEDIKDRFFVSTSPDEHIKTIEKMTKLGFDHVVLQSMSPDHKKFFEVYGRSVLPYLREEYDGNEHGRQ